MRGRGTEASLAQSRPFFGVPHQADDELPECILGAGRWPFADYADQRIKVFGS